jgi:hypothetical protein
MKKKIKKEEKKMMEIQIDEEAAERLEVLVEFFSMVVEDADYNNVTETAIHELYRQFEKVNTFQSFLKEKERTA